jgi:hypothetical protein
LKKTEGESRNNELASELRVPSASVTMLIVPAFIFSLEVTPGAGDAIGCV